MEKEWRPDGKKQFLSLGQGLALPGHHQEATLGGSHSAWEKAQLSEGDDIILGAQMGNLNAGKLSAMGEGRVGQLTRDRDKLPTVVQERRSDIGKKGSRGSATTTPILRPFSPSQPLTSLRPGDGSGFIWHLSRRALPMSSG